VVERRDPSVDRIQGADSGIIISPQLARVPVAPAAAQWSQGSTPVNPGAPGCLVVIGERLIGGRRRVQRSVARVILGGLREMCVAEQWREARLGAEMVGARDHCARRRRAKRRPDRASPPLRTRARREQFPWRTPAMW
jgi:hypothetical protein